MTKIVNEDSFTIGRSMDCTIPLQEDSISRVHLVVHRRQDQIWVEDKGSSNGTFINNVRIAQNSLVNIVGNDRIRVGKSDYVLSVSLEVEEREEGAAPPNNDETELLKPPAAPILKKQEAPAPVAPAAPATPASENNDRSIPVQMHPQKPQQQGSAFNPAQGSPILVAKDKQPPAVARPEVRRPSQVEEQGYSSNTPQFEGEKILHEAHKKAAQIIYDGEVQAEKRAQSIYMEARERQAQADHYYQKKVQDAHKQADTIIVNFQSFAIAIQDTDLMLEIRRGLLLITDFLLQLSVFSTRVTESSLSRI